MSLALAVPLCLELAALTGQRIDLVHVACFNDCANYACYRVVRVN